MVAVSRIMSPAKKLRGVYPRSRRDAQIDWPERLTIVAIWNLLISGLVTETFGTSEIVSLGFYSVHIIDPLVVISLLASGASVLKRGLKINGYSIAAGIVALLIFANLVRGLIVSPAEALLTFRANGADATILLMAVTMMPTPRVMHAVKRAMVLTVSALCLLIVLRFIFGPLLFIRLTDVTAADINDGGRPVSQVGAFIMVFGEAMLLSSVIRAGRITGKLNDLLALGLPIMIVATEQGTASIAAVLVLGIVFALERGPHPGLRFGIAVGGAIVAAVLIITYLSILSNNSVLVHRGDNFETRRMVWNGLTALWPTYPYTTQLFGLPDGQQPRFFIFQNYHWRLWDRSMHSMYYGALPMMGYLGLIAFFGLMAKLLWDLAPVARKQGRRSLLPVYPFALCVAVMVLSASYEIRNEAMIAILIAIWWMRASSAADVALRRDARAVPSPVAMRARQQSYRPAAPSRDS